MKWNCHKERERNKRKRKKMKHDVVHSVERQRALLILKELK